MADATISSQAMDSASSISSVADRSAPAASLISATNSSASSSIPLNDTVPINGTDSASTPLSLGAKVGICLAGVIFFLFVLITSICQIRRRRQQRRDPSQYRHPNVLVEEESIAMSGYACGPGTTLARCFTRLSKGKSWSPSQPMRAMCDMSSYPSPHVAADSMAMASTWAPAQAVRRYDCVILSPEAQELHEHTQYVQQLQDEGGNDFYRFWGMSRQSIVEAYSVLADDASTAATRASTICTLDAKSESESAPVGGTWQFRSEVM